MFLPTFQGWIQHCKMGMAECLKTRKVVVSSVALHRAPVSFSISICMDSTTGLRYRFNIFKSLLSISFGYYLSV